MEMFIGAAIVAAVVMLAANRLGRLVRRPQVRGAAFVGGRPTMPVHPFLRPPALNGTLKARSVYVDDWHARR